MPSIFNSTAIKSLKTHKEKICAVYDLLHKNCYGYLGAQVSKLDESKLNIKLAVQHTDLKRYQELSGSRSFLVDLQAKSVLKLNSVLDNAGTESVLGQSTEPQEGQIQVKFRKGTTNEKDVFIEVWNAEKGFVSSLKATEKLKMVYNDSIFGGISWSRDMKKVVFIGELPEIAAYKAFFKDKEEEKKEEKKEEEKKEDEKKEEEKKEEHW